jgi:hypothetical protein
MALNKNDIFFEHVMSVYGDGAVVSADWASLQIWGGIETVKPVDVAEKSKAAAE